MRHALRHGGAEQLEEMSELLQSQGKEVTGLFVTKTGVRSLVPKSNSKNMLEQSMQLIAFSQWPAAREPDGRGAL